MRRITVVGVRRFALLLLVAALVTLCTKERGKLPGESNQVVGVIDGDTIELGDGRKVRLIGLNTPERGEPGYDSASILTDRLIGGRTVRLEYDRDRFDRYQRTLAYIWVDGRLINTEILKSGWGSCYFFDGSMRHSREFLLAQREAMKAHRGLWKTPHTETEESYTALFSAYRFHRPGCESLQGADPEMEIVYHVKDSAYYDGYAPCGKCRP
jgi:micrococcal nuclease